MTKIDKTNWFEHIKDPDDYAEYMDMFEKYDPEGYARYEHEEHLSAMAQAEQERQAFRNYYETNDEQWDEICGAMAKITEQLGLDSGADNDD